MPQMAPISWLILFFIFSCAFIMFNILNYYCKPNSQSNNNNNKMNENKMNLNYNINNNKNWKW